MISAELAQKKKKGSMLYPKENIQQGVLLYRGNRFIRRLEGPLDVVTPGADPDALIMASHVLLGKRNYQQMMQGHQK